MKTANVIIGSGFGDEGKGLFTDYLSAKNSIGSCVVRFNGGAQAGHTVETPDGQRHVFGHFGSGSFAGVPTYLSSFFICSPITFLREQEELTGIGVAPDVFVDPACPVTTPYDMMINQIVEQARGDNRHGSVGVGVGETVERQSNPRFSLCVRDLEASDSLRLKLETIREVWAPRRLAALGVTSLSEEWQSRLNSDGILDHYLADVEKFLATISIARLDHIRKYDHLIFEGAQGLLLDQNHEYFPHVTRSNTGLKNVVVLADQLGIEAMDVHYISRSYTTRHGAGPLPHELSGLPYKGIIDKTNKQHPYQGALRFAWLDLDLFRKTILRDLAGHKPHITLRPHLAMSCLDQIDGDAKYIMGGELQSSSIEKLLETVRKKIGAQTVLASYGPTRRTIRVVEGRRQQGKADVTTRYASLDDADALHGTACLA